MHENNCSAQLDQSRQLWRTTCGCGQERGSLSLFQPDSVANGGERRIYWLDCPEDHRQQYCHCLYCRAQIIARHFERRRVYCRPEQETRRPAGANIGPGVIKEAAFHLWCFVQLAWYQKSSFFRVWSFLAKPAWLRSLKDWNGNEGGLCLDVEWIQQFVRLTLFSGRWLGFNWARMKNEFSSGMASLPGNYEEEENRHARCDNCGRWFSVYTSFQIWRRPWRKEEGVIRGKRLGW